MPRQSRITGFILDRIVFRPISDGVCAPLFRRLNSRVRSLFRSETIDDWMVRLSGLKLSADQAMLADLGFVMRSKSVSEQ